MLDSRMKYAKQQGKQPDLKMSDLPVQNPCSTGERVEESDYFGQQWPGMDGLEFFKRVCESHRGVLKVLITAYGNQKIFAEAVSIGVDAVIEKPFTVEILKQSLTRLLKVKNQKARCGKMQ